MASVAKSLFFVSLLVMVPGCSVEETGIDDEALVDDQGRLIVVVVSTEVYPLLGATVEPTDAEAATTDTNGEASFLLAPGTHDVHVTVEGYRPMTRSVNVAAGETMRERFVLEAIPAQEPYTELLIINGLSLCDFNLIYAAFSYWEVTGDANVPYCNQAISKFEVNVTDSWRYGIFEEDWQTGDAMHLVVDNDLTCLGDTNPCFAWETGYAPLRVMLGPADAELAARYATDGKWAPPEGAQLIKMQGTSAGNFQKEINETLPFEEFGLGVSTGNRFQVYVSLFHHERPTDPEAYSAVPDR